MHAQERKQAVTLLIPFPGCKGISAPYTNPSDSSFTRLRGPEPAPVAAAKHAGTERGLVAAINSAALS